MNVHVCCKLALIIILQLIFTKKYILCNNFEWWNNTIIYQVYPRSFKDSNDDGVGDIKGLISKLDHFVDLGVGAVSLTPIYKSPMIDLGYDITNYNEIDPLFGSLDDFEKLVNEMRKRDLKLILEFVPNHTSNQHVWFNKSVERIEPYTDYYVWQNSTGLDENGLPMLPNNWLNSANSRTAWQWNPIRKQFYYHAFHKQEPDLNLRNLHVVVEIKNSLKFWIDKGVDGFRLHAPAYYFEDDSLEDDISDIYSTSYFSNRTQYLFESFEFVEELREFVDLYGKTKDGKTRIVISEPFPKIKNYCLPYGNCGSYVQINLCMLYTFSKFYDFPSHVNDEIRKCQIEGVVPNWATSKQDSSRVADKLGDESVSISNILILLLPGVASTYYGEEIGMMGARIPVKDRKDLLGKYNKKDCARTPMQWDDSINSGFSNSIRPWLPVTSNYWHKNVKNQKMEENSHYDIYKKLSNLRKTNTCRYGKLKTFLLSPDTIAVVRFHTGEPTYIGVFNFGRKEDVVDLQLIIPKKTSAFEILVATANSAYRQGYVKKLNKDENLIIMSQRSAIVITMKPDVKDKTTEISGSFRLRFGSNFEKSLLLILSTSIIFIMNIIFAFY